MFSVLAPEMSFVHHGESLRKLCRTQATVLKEDEQKVVVEKSFKPNSSPDNEETGSHVNSSSSSSRAVERWVINLEQSINIFLTVMRFFCFGY